MPDLDNASVASLLDAMGDLLEVAGEDRFRYLSYHKAAHTIRAWHEDLAAVAADGRLTEIPGVGKKLAASIERILETGTFPEYEQLKESFEPSLVRIMDIPGVGPKRARVLHEQLGVKSVDDLEKALAEGRLTGLPGFGEKTIDNIAAGIESARRHAERLLLQDALPLATRLAEEIRRIPEVRRAEPAGSLRRRQETIGDIDIITSSEQPQAVMDAVRRLPMVARVLGSGGTKTSVLTTTGMQVDVRVVDPSEFGTALQYFTGSKEHNVALRERAKRKGLKVNEYGVFSIESGERLGGATEEEVYSLLGMPVFPPEIRLGLGEIEAAEEGRLPSLLDLADVRGDLHTHTTLTDSKSTLEQNRAKAAQLGYEYVAITDHAYNLRMVRGLEPELVREQWAAIDRLNETEGPRLLKGIELNIAEDGSVDYDEDLLAGFDLCIASLHGGFRDPRPVVTRRLLAAMENPYVDVIGHPTGRILGRRDPIDLDMDAVFRKAAETGTLLEVNSYPDRLDLSDAHIRTAKRHGVRFTLGTDAHAAEHMNFMRYGVWTARRGLLEPGDVLNCQPLDVALRWLKRARSRGRHS